MDIFKGGFRKVGAIHAAASSVDHVAKSVPSRVVIPAFPRKMSSQMSFELGPVHCIEQGIYRALEIG